jgi:hypothetical protein
VTRGGAALIFRVRLNIFILSPTRPTAERQIEG